MAEYTEDELFDMSDEELEAAFKDAKKEPEISEDINDGVQEEETTEEEVVEPDGDTEDEETEVDDDELEQPDEDSDEELDGDDDKVEAEAGDEVDPEDPDKGDEDKTAEDKAAVTEPEVPSKYKVKANGAELELTQEELIKLAPKALDYTKKMQEIAPWRKTISALQENGLGEADVNLMISAIKGDKEAIAEVLRRNEVDTMDIDVDETAKYRAPEYGKSEVELAIDEVVSTIRHEPEYAMTSEIVGSQWDAKSQQELAKAPDLIAELHKDVKSGVYGQVSPIAMKMKALDGGRKSDMEYYIMAGGEYYKGVNAQKAQAEAEAKMKAEAEAAQAAEVQKAKEAAKAQAQVRAQASRRKAAGTPKKVAGRVGVTDLLDDTDEAFDKWYADLQSRI